MELLPGWSERLKQVPAAMPVPKHALLPKSPAYYAEGIRFVEALDKAEDLVQLAHERSLSHIGFDTEFRYDQPGVLVGKKHVFDPRSIHPLLLSLALVEPTDENVGRIYEFVVDLRVEAVCVAVVPLLRLPVPFVGHYSHVELLCFLKLCLPEPRILWDTLVHEKALYMGRDHKRYKVKPGSDVAEEARAVEEAGENQRFSYSLLATCQRYGVAHPFAEDKDRLQKSFLDHPDGAAFRSEQIQYAAADALATAKLYPLQVEAAGRAGVLQHLTTVEMPWVMTNARMVWNGVRVDPEKCRQAAEACARHREALGQQLHALGLANPQSHKQLTEFFSREGLIGFFKRGQKVTFDKQILAEHRDRHPAIPLIHAYRRVQDLLSEKILSGDFVGEDGRVHPEHFQLGAHSGRQTCRWPNVLGLGRVFRPLVVPDPGHGIGEVDLSQIEIGISAAVYHDEKLIEMFNSGDVYSAMAQDFYRADLPEKDRTLPGDEFKRKHRQRRDHMKSCTLGIIYGLTPHGLAQYLRTSEHEARGFLERFLSMFPRLRAGLEDSSTYGTLRGYASTVSGLRRQRAQPNGRLATWERNWMTNLPVQGSAAVVFKVAGNRLDRLYRHYRARIIVPMHDAYVFEAPLRVLGEVAELTARTMCNAVSEYFPELHARVEVNVSHPECWNKEGHADSLDRWIDDPAYTF